ncbi:alpha-1,3-galactosyltransferase 2-like isoform X2 [Paramormyrops kingsleyae]|uniref:alpha-1,3-galactosyltransferase 2-like isoform X2 n=1 Tax=Paramormyrops kingsleyae TaxID=1676925 RepID=UPI003B973800
MWDSKAERKAVFFSPALKDCSARSKFVRSWLKQASRAKVKICFALCAAVVIFVIFFGHCAIRFFQELYAMGKCPLNYNEKLKSQNELDSSLDLWSRVDVQTCTKWGAPIMWEGTFDPGDFDRHHIQKRTSVALTVFAIGRYLEVYLKEFLKSAEQYFMVELPVTYYIFTDIPEFVPKVKLMKQRHMKVIQVKKQKRWQDISMLRMKTIADFIESHIQHWHQYIFCFDVDQVFVGRFGSEALGETVGLLHAFYYRSHVKDYTYDRNPESAAYMVTGDFYYHAAIFGGTWQGVKNITEFCHQGIMKDKEKNIEALWHDESHLNKYFWLHKPSKVLSPEYCWSTIIGFRFDIRVHRLLWATKFYDILRT